MSAPLRQSPLHALHERSGATFVEWQGGLWVDDFGDPVAEHRSVRTAAGIWDVSLLHVWEFRGARAAAAVDWLFANDAASTVPGQIRYGPFCDASGAMVTDGTTFRLGDDVIWVMTPRASDLEHLRRHNIVPDVSIGPPPEPLAAVGLQGPRSRDILTSLCPAAAGLPYYRFLVDPAPVAGVECRISRIGYTGELGYELFCRPAGAEALWLALSEAGARPYGFAAVDTLRIESGLVLPGTDYVSGETNPFDVSLDAVVATGGREFLGRAALARVATAPPRRLVSLVVEGEALPPPATAVRHPLGGGHVTSSCLSPSFGSVIALAIVDRALSADGLEVVVDTPDGPARAVVRPERLYDPRRERQRA